MRLLIAEDDPEVAAVVSRSLSRAGHAVDHVDNGADAIWMAESAPYDAILLDVNLPPPDGFEVCRVLRSQGVGAPVVFLSGRGDIADRVTGLDAGGDDYLVKPVSVRELEARLRAISRRNPSVDPTTATAGDIELDPGTRKVRRNGVEIDLTPKEFLLLEELVRRPGRTIARAELRDKLWDFAFDPRSNVLDALVRRLRTKVDLPFSRSSIETVRGVGYRLVLEPDEAASDDRDSNSGR